MGIEMMTMFPAARKIQLTESRLSWHNETKIRAGNENVPINVDKPEEIKHLSQYFLISL